jgi:Uma2 family endonuclease
MSAMATVLLDQQIEIPTIRDLGEFRAWALSDDFPDRGRIDFIDGRIEVDMSPEDFFTHGTLKTRVATEIADRVEELDLGHTLIAETRISSVPGNVSAEPDVVVISHEAFDSGRASLVPKASGEPDRFVEVEGAPDLIVEIVSDSSVKKDTHRLPRAYFAAGVRELWLIDARGEELAFQIYNRGGDAFVPGPIDKDGYQRSAVLDATYWLVRSRHARGHWMYRLRMK